MRLKRQNVWATVACVAIGGGVGLGSGFAWARTATPPAPAAVQDRVAVYFSPEGGTSDALVALIEGAQRGIRLAIYTFTDNRVADALIEAHERGLPVEVVFDADQSRIGGSERDRLQQAGVGIWLAPDDDERKMHNKFMVIDDQLVATGSYNFTYAADQKNFENLIVIDGKKKITQAFVAQHEGLKRISKKLKSPDE